MESGAILANDKSTVIGGLTLLETESCREAEKFAFDDPFEQAGIRKKTTILRWRQRWLGGQFLGDINLK